MVPFASLFLFLAQAGGASTDAPAPAPVAAASRPPLVVPTPRPKAPEVPSYKVSLRMKSGRRFAGVVCRDRPFHAIVHAGGHHTAAPYRLDERFKLRYVDGLDGDLLLCWRDVQKLEVRDILDSAGVRAMENDYATARIVRRSAAEAESAAPAGEGAPLPLSGVESGTPPPAAGAEGSGSQSGADGGATAADRKEVPLLAPKLSLLAEFPPSVGWTPERKRQIEWRRTVVGTFPDEREARFLAVYAEWEPLFLEWTVEEQRRTARESEANRPAAPAKGRAPERKSDANAPADAARRDGKESDPKGGEKKSGG